MTDKKAPNRDEMSEAELCKLTSDEVEKIFDTDLDLGLSHREARKRLSSSNGDRLFITISKSASLCMREMFASLAVGLLLAVSLVAILFEYVLVGCVCTALAVFQGVICGVLSRKSEKMDALFSEGDFPMPRVIRGGEVYRIREDRLVAGDVVIVYPGDIVAADMRIVETAGLCVEEYIYTDKGTDKKADRSPERLCKTATPCDPKGSGETNRSPQNMLYAGDVVIEGMGRAVVMQVGSSTHVGAVTGGIGPAHLPTHMGREPKDIRTLQKYFSVYSFVSVLAIIPLLIISVFTLGWNYDYNILGIFLPCIALAASSTAARSIATVRVNYTVARMNVARGRDTSLAAEIKSQSDLDRIDGMTDLVLIGTAGLDDGIPHPEWVMVGERRYLSGEDGKDEVLSRFAEYFYLTSYKDRAERGGISPAMLSELLNLWAEPELDYLPVRIETYELSSDPFGVHVLFKNGEEHIFFASTDVRTLGEATQIRTTDGEEEFTAELSARYFKAANEAEHDGYGVMILLGGNDGKCLEGMVCYGRHTCRKTRGAIKALDESGIRVVAFERVESYEHDRILTECGFADMAPMYHDSRSFEDVLNLSEKSGADVAGGKMCAASDWTEAGVRAFLGVDDAFVRDYIAYLKKQGRQIGILTVEMDSLELLDLADVAFTCNTDHCGYVGYDGDDQGTQREERDLRPDSLADSQRACDLMLRRADVHIQRSSESGGGVLGISRAINTARRCKKRVVSAVRYLILSQFLRVLFVIIPMLFGIGLPSAVAVLISGMAVDFMAIMAITFSGAPMNDFRRTEQDEYEHDGICLPLRFNTDCLSIAVSAVAMYVIAWICILTGYTNSVSAILSPIVALFGTQFILYFWCLDRQSGKRWQLSRMEFAFVVMLVLTFLGSVVYTLLQGMLIGWLGVALVQPLLFLVLSFYFRRKNKV